MPRFAVKVFPLSLKTIEPLLVTGVLEYGLKVTVMVLVPTPVEGVTLTHAGFESMLQLPVASNVRLKLSPAPVVSNEEVDNDRTSTGAEPSS